MSFEYIQPIITIDELKQKIPLQHQWYEIINHHRQEIKNIINGSDKRLLIIVGPCSAWPYDAVIHYAELLCELNKIIRHKLKLVMRVYTQKSRTNIGWAGPMVQPDPLNSHDIISGIEYSRKLMIDITKMGLAIADEMLSTHNMTTLDLLSWTAVGARSTENWEHRIMASGIEYAVGMKNSTDGCIETGIDSVLTAQQQHLMILEQYVVKTTGNAHAHLVLRGGRNGPNYKKHNIHHALKLINDKNIINPAIIIDASHDNCIINNSRDYTQQKNIPIEIMNTIHNDDNLNGIIKGFMLESFIEGGNQEINSNLSYNGLSITDSCLDWNSTVELLLKIANY